MSDDVDRAGSDELRAMQERYEQLLAISRERLRTINAKLETLASGEMDVIPDPTSTDQLNRGLGGSVATPVGDSPDADRAPGPAEL